MVLLASCQYAKARLKYHEELKGKALKSKLFICSQLTHATSS